MAADDARFSNPVARMSGVGVELLVKGALPDACSALDVPTQERAGRLVTVTLTMRQPRVSSRASAARASSRV